MGGTGGANAGGVSNGGGGGGGSYGATGNRNGAAVSSKIPPPEQLSQGWVSVPLTEEKQSADGWDQWDEQTGRSSSQKKAFDGWGDAPGSESEDDGEPATGDDGWAVDPDNSDDEWEDWS